MTGLGTFQLVPHPAGVFRGMAAHHSLDGRPAATSPRLPHSAAVAHVCYAGFGCCLSCFRFSSCPCFFCFCF